MKQWFYDRKNMNTDINIKKLNTIEIFGIGFSSCNSDAEIEIKLDDIIFYKGVVKTIKNCNLDEYLKNANLNNVKIVSWVENLFPNSKKLSIKSIKGNFLYTETVNGFGDAVYTYTTDTGSVISDPNTDIMLDGTDYDIGIPSNFTGNRGQWAIDIPEGSTMTCKLRFSWEPEKYGSFEFMKYFFNNLSKFGTHLTNTFVKKYMDMYFQVYSSTKELETYNAKELIAKSRYKTVFTINDPEKVLKVYNNRYDVKNEKENYDFLLNKNLGSFITQMVFTNNCCIAEKVIPLCKETLNKWGITINRLNNNISSLPTNEWIINDCNSLSLINHTNVILTNLIYDNNPENFGVFNNKIVILDLDELRKDFVLNNLELIQSINV